MKYKKTVIPFFEYAVYFVLINDKTTEIDVVTKFKIQINGLPEIDENSAKICTFSDTASSYIFFNKKNKLPVIVHEISHLVDHIFHYFGFSWEDGELKAYLIEYIFKEYLINKERLKK